MTSHSTLRKELGKGTKIGALVYWRNLAGGRIPRAVFRTGVRAAGLGDALHEDPSPEAMLHAAVSQATRRQPRDAERAKVELKDKDTHATYAVLMRRDDGSQRRYIEESVIAVDRKTGAVTVHDRADSTIDPARSAVVDAVLAAYEEMVESVSTSEVSQTLVSAMTVLDALTLRPGVYFVPAAGVERLDRLRDFLERQARIHVTAWDIGATDDNVAEVRRDARESLLGKLDELVAEVERFVAKVGDDDPQERSVDIRLARFKELDGQVHLYADILGDYQAELRGAIAGARDALLGKYLGEEVAA